MVWPIRRLIAITLVVLFLAPGLKAQDKTSLRAALEAARWIRASTIQSASGAVWPADPRDPQSISNTLYSGNPGVILFFLEAFQATGDKANLQDARSGADHLLASFSNEKDCGLYEGISGIGFALEETFKATGDSKYRRGAVKCAELLRERAVKTGRGVEWNDSTDIISGGAGIGLFLLYAAKQFKDALWIELACHAANRLIELARPEGIGGAKWAVTPTFKRLMPNFSHGTAGVAYFLSTLYEATKKTEFLNAALAGANYLKSVARTDGDVCLIFHNEPDGRELFYLGWCHGPVGTARLFYRLYLITGERAWMDWVRKSARAILQSGVPEKQTPGFWNNVSQCCGSAGIAQFFLDLYQVTRDRQYLDFSRRVVAQLLSNATRDGAGMRWIQAEHRIKPELLVAQTGYMQGAAGVGMLLLHIDQFERAKKASIIFPDSPF